MPSIFTISNLISKSSSSHSSDPINLAAFKKLNYTLSPYILDIIIISLNDGICPTSFKHNNLLLNSSKSALLNIPSNYHNFPPVIINGLPIIPSSSVINRGVTLNDNLSLNYHIANISKSANYHLFKIRRKRKDLTRPLTTVLINALVLSRIDYCSSLLYHLPNTSLSPLNRIIRASVRTIFSINRFDHSITDSH